MQAQGFHHFGVVLKLDHGRCLLQREVGVRGQRFSCRCGCGDRDGGADRCGVVVGALGDLGHGQPEQRHLLDTGETVGFGHGVASFVLIPLRHEPVDVGGGSGVDHRRQALSGMRCGQRAAFPSDDDDVLAVAVGQDWDQDSLGRDRLDECGVGLDAVSVAGAHVRADGDGVRVEVLHRGLRGLGGVLIGHRVLLGDSASVTGGAGVVVVALSTISRPLRGIQRMGDRSSAQSATRRAVPGGAGGRKEAQRRAAAGQGPAACRLHVGRAVAHWKPPEVEGTRNRGDGRQVVS